MSEQVNYRQQWADGEIEAGTLLDAIDSLQYANIQLAQKFGVAHAEAEALRAENGRLKREAKNDAIAYKAVIERQNQLREERDSFQRVGIRAMEELEAARGLLVADLQKLIPELDDALEDLELHGCHDQQGYRKLKDWFRKVEIQTRKLDAALTATPAPEVRQEAKTVCMGCVDQASRIRELEHKMDYYTTPQPGPDVRALVEALEQIADARETPTLGDPNVLRVIAFQALAAHRQAQRKGERHG